MLEIKHLSLAPTVLKMLLQVFGIISHLEVADSSPQTRPVDSKRRTHFRSFQMFTKGKHFCVDSFQSNVRLFSS